MPEPTRVVVEISYVRNLGNYETVRVHLGVHRDVPEGIRYLDALRMLKGEVEAAVSDAIAEIDADAGKVNAERKKN